MRSVVYLALWLVLQLRGAYSDNVDQGIISVADNNPPTVAIFLAATTRPENFFKLFNIDSGHEASRFTLVDASDESKLIGSLLDEAYETLFRSSVLAFVLEELPTVSSRRSVQSPAVAMQAAFDIANSLDIPVIVVDSQRSRSPLSSNDSMLNFWSVTPSRNDVDTALMTMLLGIFKKSGFAIVSDSDDAIGDGGLVEKLLTTATWLGQSTAYLRISPEDVGDDSSTWHGNVAAEVKRWRKFVIATKSAALGRRFIQKALSVGVAGQGYAYISVNFDFRAEPLGAPCWPEGTIIASFRLRRARSLRSHHHHNKQGSEHDDHDLDDDRPFNQMAMIETLKVVTRAAALTTKDWSSDIAKDKAKVLPKLRTKFKTILDTLPRSDWLLEVLNITDDGYLVTTQYSFGQRKTFRPTILNDHGENSIWVQSETFDQSHGQSVDEESIEEEARSVSAGIAKNVTIDKIVDDLWASTLLGGDNDVDSKDHAPVKPLMMQSETPAAASCERRRRLRIATLIEPPFIMRDSNNKLSGFCVDLLKVIAEDLGFVFDLELVPDGKYGSLQPSGTWSGLIGELETGKADMALGPLTITRARSRVVDFAYPFMTVGIGVLYYHEHEPGSSDEDIESATGSREGWSNRFQRTFSFFRPFDVKVWTAAAIALVVYSLGHKFVSMMSPLERETSRSVVAAAAIAASSQRLSEIKGFTTTIPPPINLWSLSNVGWFGMSSLMQQGCEYYPGAAATRLVAIVWWFVGLVLASCYTANLAAFLTTERLDVPLSQATDLLTQNKTKYGTLQGGSTHQFFSNSRSDRFRELHANMARDKSMVTAHEEGIQRVIRERGAFAYFLESSKLEYEVKRDCRLIQVGTLLDSKGYGIAVQKASPLCDAISTALLRYNQDGTIAELKEKWWRPRVDDIPLQCPDRRATALAIAAAEEEAALTAVSMGQKRTQWGDSSGASQVLKKRSPVQTRAHAQQQASSLTIRVVGGAFIVLFGGLALGIIACGIENFIYGRTDQNPTFVDLERVFGPWERLRQHWQRIKAAGLWQVTVITQEMH